MAGITGLRGSVVSFVRNERRAPMPKKLECGILLPVDILVVRSDKACCPCVLPAGHDCSEHVAIIEDGKYVLWSSALDCGCHEFPECDCFDYSYASKEEANRFLLKYWNP
jgi:hypothetical protein